MTAEHYEQSIESDRLEERIEAEMEGLNYGE